MLSYTERYMTRSYNPMPDTIAILAPVFCNALHDRTCNSQRGVVQSMLFAKIPLYAVLNRDNLLTMLCLCSNWRKPSALMLQKAQHACNHRVTCFRNTCDLGDSVGTPWCSTVMLELLPDGRVNLMISCAHRPATQPG